MAASWVSSTVRSSTRVTEDMEHPSPLYASSLCVTCPNPDLIACRGKHFGRDVWLFECEQAAEVFVKDKGIVIKCSGTGEFCCVEDGRDAFVGAPKVNSLRDFLETTLDYLGLKKTEQ